MNLSRTILLAGAALATALPARADIAALFDEGKPILNVRARVETVDQDGVSDATAYTIRTRLGYQTAKVDGFQALLEFEDVTALDYDGYNAAGLNGQPGKAVVLDPEATEINRFWAAYSSEEAGTFKLGRQLVVYDDHRHIGHVGWRQNIQTFDALSYSGSFGESFQLNAAYLDEVHRILGDDHPAGSVDLDAILLNGGFAPAEGHKLVAFAYLVESDQLAGWSSDTFGLRATGAIPTGEESKLNYAASYATQGDNGGSPATADFSLDYMDLQLWTTLAGFTFGGGYESLEGDGARGYSTPLATVHKFNGWADVFAGATISGGLASGLEDTYLKLGYTFQVGNGLPVTLVHHWFDAERTGADLGTELDLVANYKINDRFTAIFKYAMYDGGDSALADRDKLWLELNFAY